MAELNEILGNESLKEHFITAVHHKKISHAYIMEGDKGSGKKCLPRPSLKYCSVKAGKLRVWWNPVVSVNLVYRWNTMIIRM